ncbi:sensor histidine kinase [Paenarthrobacter aurescens]|nr:ATP-binding protein [Paenarthrobacter aurescens]
MSLMVPIPNGVSAKETHKLMGRGIAAFALLLLLQVSGSIVTQSGLAAPWWNAMFLWLLLTGIGCFSVASIRGRGLRWTSSILSLLVLAGLLLWPAAVPTTVPVDIGTPWLWAMINVGAAWSAFAFGTLPGCVYTVVIGSVFAVVRTLPQSGSASPSTAIQDASFSTVLGIIICLTIGILRQASERVDTAAENAINRYREAAAETALSNERTRVDGLLHDSVMSALLTASRSGSSLERLSSAELARSALARLGEHEIKQTDATTVSVSELASRIRFTVQDDGDTPTVTVTGEGSTSLLLSGQVVRALFEASTEAVANAVRHSNATRCEVRVLGQDPKGIARVVVSVKDNGDGFRQELVSDRRLGIKVSIIGRMRTIGGTADISSHPGKGTEVILTWAGEA